MGAVYIIEGIAGSGKDTLAAAIVAALRPQERRVLAFSEEALLATWLYYFVPGIHDLRLDLTRRLVQYAEHTLAREPDAAFVFNRFHVSHAVWRQELGADLRLEERHQALVAQLKGLPVRIVQAVLQPDEAEARSRHVERVDIAWQRFLDERLHHHGHKTAGESYLVQQETMTRILERDGLPYVQVHVEPGAPLDIERLLLRP